MMHGIRKALAVVWVLTFAVGCQSATSPAGSPGPTGTGGTTGGSGFPASGGNGGAVKPGSVPYTAQLSTQTTTASITDPSLNNIVSATLTIPAGWGLQGITMISACTFSPWPVFRAYSRDALMQMRIEPVIGWQWNPQNRVYNSGCANLSGQVSAANFLQYYMGSIQGGVHVEGPMAVAPAYSQWAQGLAAQKNQLMSHAPPAMQGQNTADTAAIRIEVVNGSFVVEERLRTVVECSMNSNSGTCWARVDVLSAPQGRLDALVQMVDNDNLPHGVNSAQWTQAALARQQREGQQAMANLTAQEQRESQMIYQQFVQIMQRSAAEHQAFMQQQESQFESAMNNANAAMNAQTTAASDWVDYSLDQETVLNPDGSTTKVSAGYSQTWTNGTQWYQTDEPNGNPNGVLPGNWSPTPQTHGNGQPM
jgi:hypothetical protein